MYLEKRCLVVIILLIILSCDTIDINQTVIEEKLLIVSSKTGLKLREEPTKKSTIIDIIPYGSFVEVVEKTKGKELIDGIYNCWYKIEYKDKTAWVFGGYLVEKVELNPIVGKWELIQDNKQIWFFHFDGTILAGYDSTDNIFYDGTYKLLGNRLYIDSTHIDRETEESSMSKDILVVEFVDMDKIILRHENGVTFELKRTIKY